MSGCKFGVRRFWRAASESLIMGLFVNEKELGRSGKSALHIMRWVERTKLFLQCLFLAVLIASPWIFQAVYQAVARECAK